MIHAFLLGPLETGEGLAWCVAGARPDGEPVKPEVQPSPQRALKAFLKRHAVEGVASEPGALAQFARPLGLEVTGLSGEALRTKGSLAYALALGPLAGRPSPEALNRLFAASRRFLDEEPWGVIDSDAVAPATFRVGTREVTREVSIMGAGGEEFGVAIYDEPGSVLRVIAAMDAGRPQEASRVDALSVTFDEEPAWAVDALRAAFGLGRLPFPLRLRRGRPSPATAEELLQLAAVLEAAVLRGAEETPEDLAEVVTQISAAGLTVTARLGIPELPAEPLDDDLAEPMLVPEPLPVTRRERTPRNAPCPCGSGRKYKKCHLAEDEARESAARGQGPEAEEARATQRRLSERDPVHALDERITADALALARQRWGRAFGADEAFLAFGYDFQALQAVQGWASAHLLGPDGRTALDLYVAERGDALDEAGRRLVEAQREAWFSLHEVVALDPGATLRLRDLLAGDERTVEEKSGSRTLRPHAVIMARVLDLGDRAILAGCHPRPLPPREGRAALELVRRRLKARGAKVSPKKLRAGTADGTILATWQAFIADLDAAPPPRLQNTDGEDLLLTVDRFEVQGGGEDQVLARLATLPDAQGVEEEEAPARGRSVSFVRQGNAKGVLPTTLVGRAIVEDAVLRLETNSVERADRLRGLVTERLGPLVRFKVREHSDPVAGLGTRASRGPVSPLEAATPEVLEVIRRMQAEHYARWLDEPIPALGGLSPRQASRASGPVLGQLDLLLAEVEHHEAGQPSGQRLDVATLRRELGRPG